MDKIYLVEYQSLGDPSTVRELITARSIPELFEEFSCMTNLIHFAFQEVTQEPLDSIERKLTYRGKYSL